MCRPMPNSRSAIAIPMPMPNENLLIHRSEQVDAARVEFHTFWNDELRRSTMTLWPDGQRLTKSHLETVQHVAWRAFLKAKDIK